MYHQYTINYYVTYSSVYKDNKTAITNLDILEVFKLMDTTIGGFDGWSHNDNTDKSLIITPGNWRNIALIPINEDNLYDLIEKGAELKNSNYVFDNKIDAKIQLAFTASKYNVKISDIYEISNGILPTSAYEKLLDLFYDEFPEKFI